MDAIEKRALDLLCGEIDLNPEDYDEGERISAGEALRAIIAALTTPERYVPERSVLSAATQLRKMASAATPMARSAYIKAAEMVEMAVIAARPEVP